ncbi:MAG: S1 RNA-binding domain-containing protein [Candidatus Paceibacterota bacterium]
MGIFSRKSAKTDEVKVAEEVVETKEAKKATKEIKEKDKVEETNEEKEARQKKQSLMGKLMSETKNPPSVGDLVEGPVIAIEKASVYVDLAPYGTGIIYGREFIVAREIIKKINVGDVIAAKVVGTDHEEGYWELSLKEARQAIVWSEAEAAIASKTIFELPVKEANKGGLILEWQGISGFLPASQLKPEHYPRVEDGDKDRILEELKKLLGQKIAVAIIGANPKEGKLIFSEKNPEQKEKEKIVEKYTIGDVLDGEVTGIVDFGVFVKVEDGLEGLVHISEMDWALVENPKLLYKVGDKIRVKVIDVKDGKISLSIKALKPNPWIEAGKKYKKDQLVKGVVIKFNKHGALASIEEGVAGLVHVSEFGSEEKLREKLELGKTYSFKIALFDAKEQKMALSFVEATK